MEKENKKNTDLFGNYLRDYFASKYLFSNSQY